MIVQALGFHALHAAQGQKITYNVIKQRLGDVLYKLTSQKFEDPCKCYDRLHSSAAVCSFENCLQCRHDRSACMTGGSLHSLHAVLLVAFTSCLS